ncbi:MAG: ATP-binding protein [Treponema sp.]|nr:ATP-binding protein [Treponema sp.]
MAKTPSPLKEWAVRYQIAIINASLTILLIAVVIVVLLSRFSSLQRRTAEESVINLAGMTANEVQADYLTYFDVVRTVSQIMKSYETIEVTHRRTFFNDIMEGILNSNSSLVSLYTIWKPYSLDDRDDEYIDADDPDNTGQYITGYTRERGMVERRDFTEYSGLVDYYNRIIDNISYNEIENFRASIIGPDRQTVDRKATWVINIHVPILKNYRAVGIVGATINLDQLQNLIESRNPYTDGRSMVVTTNGNNRIIIAHYNADFRGLDLARDRVQDPHFSADAHSYVDRAVQDSIINLKPGVIKTEDTLMVSYSLKATNPRLASFALNESTNPPWAVVTMVPLSSILSPINILLRFSILFVIGAGILVGVVFFATSRSMTQRTRLLQQDLERATTMQDNVKYGLFLMDQKYVIQGAYSKALEKLLSVSNLQGKVFPELLTSSIKANECSSLQDYFEMIFKRSFDEEMLESINPIFDFTYTSIETGESKHLRTNFTLAEWGRGRSLYILGTMEDITAERELERQLHDSENQREKEMQALFQVVQLNPGVLNDFIEDSEYEFDQINALLKNKENINPDILVEIYQSVHAIKSNALILNLEDFSGKLHKLETSIKNLQEKQGTESSDKSDMFDDILGLVLELNDVMKEKDQLKGVISKIENFRNISGNDSNQEKYVLVETLTQACKKVMKVMNKEARLIVEDMDEIVLEHGPRRVIKEILTQLVRNAVYHGIETPQERISLGKNPEGEIRLSVVYRQGEIIMKLSDNGKGIDFDEIRQKAIGKNLFKNPEEAEEKANLLKVLFLPGFSTTSTVDLHGGRGIGLSLVKTRIKEMQGNINVSSAPGKGTAFTVVIPLELPY